MIWAIVIVSLDVKTQHSRTDWPWGTANGKPQWHLFEKLHRSPSMQGEHANSERIIRLILLSHSKTDIQQILWSFCLRSCYWMLLSVLSHDAQLHKLFLLSFLIQYLEHWAPLLLLIDFSHYELLLLSAERCIDFLSVLCEITVFIYSPHFFQIMDNIAWTSPCIVRSPNRCLL